MEKNRKLTRAAVLYEVNCPLAIKTDISIPPLSSGQILVKVAFSGVCHSQLMEVRGKRGEDKFLPHMLGHEGSGTVLEIGSGVTKVKLGDNVILGWIKGEGLDVPGTKYTCEAFFDTPEKRERFRQTGYTGDYSFIYFE